jgi:aminoglycoside N3'-acetyltransferase
MIGVRDCLRPAYHAARERLARLDRAIDRRTLTRADFEQLLGELGIKPGATVLVHSSMDVVARRVPELTPVELIRMLQRLVTESGTLLMPTFPFTGKQAHYADTTSRFDVRRTPSQVGLMPEVFRRMSDVARSLHPTHPVAAWGRHARTLLADHHRGGAFGTNSPIYRLREFDGVVVGLGTGLRDSFTILHVPEELHPKARARFFESHSRTMTIVDDGHELSYTFHALRPDVRRTYSRVERVLVREGILRYVTAKGLRCAVTNAGAFIDRCMRLVDEGRYL